MKKILLVTCFVLIFVASYALYYNNLSETNETLLLGYCPTMEQEANKIASNNKNIQLIKYQSTIDVLKDLNQNKIDIALVGRVAKSSELKHGFNELRLEKGFTLVNSQKKLIHYSELKNIIINTYLSKQEVQEFLGSIDNVIFHENINDIKSNEIFLIDWEDYNETYELLIPIDENNLKIKKFRIPVLYSYNNLEKLKLN
ncbi:MAG: hypothetical protein ACOCXG_02110 [Nanoarchaeota archaeon]